MPKNEEAWQKVFEHLNIGDRLAKQGFVHVSAEDLKEYGKREPRLMAKLDTQEMRPKIFRDLALTIFPVTNGEYIIFKDSELKSYYNFNSLLDDTPIEEYNPTRDMSFFQTLSNKKILSESQAIDFAYLVSLLKTFTGEDELYLTIRGRLFSNSFNFTVPQYNHTVEVTKVQIEVDAGYESRDKIYIIEAKVGKRDNFHIRQLYYPFKDWSIKTTKEVVPIFFTYTNGLFYLTQFKFGDNFGDISVVKSQCFIINENPVQSINLKQLLESTIIEKEPKVPYPQANDLDKVIDIVTHFVEGELDNKQNIATYFDFDERQGDYYANAAIYLGFLERIEARSGKFKLTDIGNRVANCNNRSQRNLILLKQLLKKPSFNGLFKSIKTKSDLQSISIDTIESVIRKNTTLTLNTPKRRASTVKSWLSWIYKNMEIQ